MIGDTAIFRNREAERSRVQNHPRSGTGRPSYSEARPPESENPHDRRLSSRFMPIRSDANRRFHASDIEAGIQEMHAQKVPLGTTAEPMPDFGL